MNYRQKVAEGRRLVKRSEEDQWALAKLSREVIDSGKTQQQWASDIGVTQPHVSYLIRIHDSYNQVINKPAFADAYAQVKGMPLDRRERRENEAISNIKKASPERQKEIARELVANPEVRRTIREALHEETDLEMIAGGGRVPQLSELNARSSALDPMINHGELLNSGIRSIKTGVDQIKRAGPLTDDEAREVRELAMSVIDLVSEGVH